jgi:BMFP domain-containing protein YqiC
MKKPIEPTKGAWTRKANAIFAKDKEILRFTSTNSVTQRNADIDSLLHIRSTYNQYMSSFDICNRHNDMLRRKNKELESKVAELESKLEIKIQMYDQCKSNFKYHENCNIIYSEKIKVLNQLNEKITKELNEVKIVAYVFASLTCGASIVIAALVARHIFFLW